MKAATEILKADTRKTSNLVKRYLKQKYNIKASVRVSKFAGGDSIDIKYTLGPDSRMVKSELAGLVRGSFNGMEDIYENNPEWQPVVFEGYELESYKYMDVKQDIPKDIMFRIAQEFASYFNFENSEELNDIDDMYKTFNNGHEYTSWKQIVLRHIDKWHFATDEAENVYVDGIAKNKEGFDYNIIYILGDDKYSTENLKPITMDKVEFKQGMSVKVSYKNGTSYEGTIEVVKDKSLKVVASTGDNKLVMLSAATVEVIGEANAKPETKTKATEPSKKEEKEVGNTNTPAKEEKPVKRAENKPVKMKAFMKFISSLEGVVSFPEKELEIAKDIVLTPAGNKALKALEKDYKDGKYEGKIADMVAELANIGKTMVKGAKSETKATEQPVSKEEPEMHPVLKAATMIKSDADFTNVEVLAATEGVQFVGRKNSKFTYRLLEYKNGNIYVLCEQNDKKYYSMPSRFNVHFDVK